MKLTFCKLLKLKRIIKKAKNRKVDFQSFSINGAANLKDNTGETVFISKKKYRELESLFQDFVNIIFVSDRK